MSSLYYFNPTVDLELANGSPFYIPPKGLQVFGSDLESIMLWIMQEGDWLYTHKPLSHTFKSYLKKYNILPKIIAMSDSDHLTISDVQPWGWSPYVEQKFKHRYNCPLDIKQHKHISDRSYANALLSKISEQDFISYQTPVVCKSNDEIRAVQKQWRQVVIKSPHSSSGRGLQMLRKSMLNESNLQWISGVLKEQGAVILEPLYNKQFDLSYHFKSNGKEIQCIGICVFNTNSNGQYQSTFIGEWKHFIPAHLHKMVSKTQSLLSDLLTNERVHEKYVGFFGVDAFIHLHNETFKIQPIVEINFRNTMGLVALNVGERLGLNKATFSIEKITKDLKNNIESSDVLLPISDIYSAQKVAALVQILK